MDYTENEQKKIFSDNLNRILEEKNVLKIELAEALNISPSAISHWLDGSSMPRAKTIQNITRYLKITVNDLMNPYNPNNKKELDIKALIDLINSNNNKLTYNGTPLTDEQINTAKAVLSVFKNVVDK